MFKRSLLLSLLFSSLVFGRLINVTDIAGLATSRPGDGDVAILANGDIFQYDADSVVADNGVSVINGPSNVGRFLKLRGKLSGTDVGGNVSGATTATFGWGYHNVKAYTVTGATTISSYTFVGRPPGIFALKLTQDATGYAVTLPALTSGTAPTVNTNANAVTVIYIYYDGTNGHYISGGGSGGPAEAEPAATDGSANETLNSAYTKTFKQYNLAAADIEVTLAGIPFIRIRADGAYTNQLIVKDSDGDIIKTLVSGEAFDFAQYDSALEEYKWY